MKRTLGVIMDPIEHIKTYKDSTFAMLLEARSREWDIYYMNQENLFLDNESALCTCKLLRVYDDPDHWFDFQDQSTRSLNDFDVILMRKDPPFDMEYIYTTYLLDIAQKSGTMVINSPKALRSFNEKLSITRFPKCCAPYFVSRNKKALSKQAMAFQDCVIKPLDGMGGKCIFRLRQGDDNLDAIIESLTPNDDRTLMLQRYIPEISNGDKRILLINGKPIPYALARIPKKGDFRGNLAAGGSYKGVELSERDRWICSQLETTLVKQGLFFVGIDVIGDYLTEINVTSPTCIRELDTLYDLNIAATLFNAVEHELDAPH